MKTKIVSNFSLLFVALIWFFVLIPKEIFAIISLLIILYLFLKKKINLNDKIVLTTILIGLISFIATLFSIIRDSYDFSRILAAINTSLSWIIAGIAYGIFQGNFSNKRKLSKIASINLLIIIMISLLSIILNRVGINFSLLGSTLNTDDWINGVKQNRLLAFFEYSSLITSFILINLGLYFLSPTKNKLFNIFLLIMSFIPILLSLSRICIVAYIVFLFFYIFYKIKKTNYGNLILLSAFFLTFFAVIIFSNQLIKYIYDIVFLREGSNNTRMTIYALSFSEVLNKNFLFGIGIKSLHNGIPLGSHSTYIGMLYKSGILGCLIFLILLYAIIKMIFKSNVSFEVKGVFISFLFIFLFEDIDGTNWLIFYVFFLLSQMSLRRINTYEINNKNLSNVIPN